MIREQLRGVRENVVQAVMRRNRLQDEVDRLERVVEGLRVRRETAERIHNTVIADEVRVQQEQRQGELEKLRAAYHGAEAEAEAAKIRLPTEELRLQQRVAELKAQFVDSVGDHILGAANPDNVGGTPSDAEITWDRARQKMQDIGREASARDEVAAVQAGQMPEPRYKPDRPWESVDETAESLLTALETRLGLASEEGEGSTAAKEVLSPTQAFLGFEELPAPRPSFAAHPNLVRSTKGEASSMDPTQRVRVAAIGTGSIFRGAHLPVYPEIAQAQLVAFCDPDKTAQDQAYKRYQGLVEAKIKLARERDDMATVERLENDLETVQICDDINEVLELVKPDLVDICTQPLLHAPLSIQALEAGINVMCEKPISRSWLESQRVIAAVERTGKSYQHNENWLWDPDYYTAKKLVDAGAIGEPILMFLATAHGGPEGAAKFWNSDFGGGGALLDNGIHAIGASWYISGLDKRPTVVKAAEPFGMSIRMPNRILDGRYQKVTVDDDAHILIRFENAEAGSWSTAHVEGSWSHRDSPDTAIIGTTGKIVFKNEDGKRYAVVIDSYDREARRIETSGPTWQPWPSSFYGEILNMVESVRNGVPSLSNANFGADCSAIVGASYLSEKNGRRGVHIDEFKAFAHAIADKFPNDPDGADNALVDALLSAVRK